MAQLLSNLPIGAKIKFGKYSVKNETAQPITWVVVAKNHGGTVPYPQNSVTLLTEKIIDIRCIDAREPKSPNSIYRTHGNGRYSVSNIDQWLNKDSAAGAWYAAAHSTDQAPDSGYVDEPLGAEYATRPGFLHAFSEDEKSAILNTDILVHKSDYEGGGTETISRKVFLPSKMEISTKSPNTSDGERWEYFINNVSLRCSLSKQAYDNVPSTHRPSKIDDDWMWWTRTTESDDASLVYFAYLSAISDGGTSASASQIGIRPALNLTSLISVSDGTDSDGCYTIVFNEAPITPPIFYLPSNIYGGKANSISWGVATDPDGDAVTYQLECSVDGGDYTEIYNGAAVVYAHTVPFGASTVSYRVKATDIVGESSAYMTSATINVVNNNAPIISGTDANLGIKSEGFTGTYTVTDADNDIITVTEAIDGIRIRSIIARLGEEITYGVTENTWLALPNGSHTLTISATDGIDTTVRTLVFTKLVDSFKIQNSTPWVSSTMPTRIMLVVTRNIPTASTFKVEVCNNGFDASPAWEDATDAVMSGLVHVFTNTQKTAENWGVSVKVTVERNGATGACYVSAIGGNFE
jgi:hypothetical protein